MPKPNSEIEYPIASTVLIDYLKNSSVYPVYMGSDFISFSNEPFMGGKLLPPNTNIYCDKMLTRSEVENILEGLNLRIDDFEGYLSGLL